jgi:large subunit ribosomal protein L13
MTLMYKTKSAHPKNIETKWVEIDAAGQVVGRLASRIATILRGKDKPYFTPHMACGSNVIVMNMDKVFFTGKKEEDKVYLRYTGYPGGQRSTSPKLLRARFPERILEHAVKGMLPKNKLGRKLLKNMRLYRGDQHPHVAQNPTKID